MDGEPLVFHLFNGAKTKAAWDENSSEFIDDGKPEERRIPCAVVQVTYGTCVHLYDHYANMILALAWTEKDPDLLFLDGVWYGDFQVVPAQQ